MRQRGACEANACAVVNPMPSLLTPVIKMVRSLMEAGKVAATSSASVVCTKSGFVVEVMLNVRQENADL